MSTEKAEKVQTGEVAPVPPTPTPASVETTPNEVAPAGGPVENKYTAAFIKMRQEKRELKRQLEQAKSTPTPPVAPETESPKPEVKEQPTAPAPKIAEVDIEAESIGAIETMAKDKDIAAVPGAIMDIIDMVDNDPRLSRLHSIDPTLAFREAKAIWSSKVGISTPPPMAKPTHISGGISEGKVDLAALMSQADKLKPGTREYSELVRKINAEMKKQGISL